MLRSCSVSNQTTKYLLGDPGDAIAGQAPEVRWLGLDNLLAVQPPCCSEPFGAVVRNFLGDRDNDLSPPKNKQKDFTIIDHPGFWVPKDVERVS